MGAENRIKWQFFLKNVIFGAKFGFFEKNNYRFRFYAKNWVYRANLRKIDNLRKTDMTNLKTNFIVVLSAAENSIGSKSLSEMAWNAKTNYKDVIRAGSIGPIQ